MSHRDHRRQGAVAVAGILAIASALLAAPPASAATAVDLSFDFGGPVSLSPEGWIGISPSSIYSSAAGYGFITAPGAFRDRAGTDLMKKDFVLGAPYEFVADVPNGTYEVTAWFGDLEAGNRTNIELEGTAYASPRTSTGAIHEQFFPAVQVADGQLTLKVVSGDGRINGLRVQSPAAAPADVHVVDVDVDTPSVELAWTALASASGYTILRGEGEAALTTLATVDAPGYLDTTVELGSSYRYAVATNRDGRQSSAGAEVTVPVIDPDVAPPAVPTGIHTTDVQRNAVSLAWDDDPAVVAWRVYRTTRADIPFERIATVDDPAFQDADVLTTRPFLYRVVAVNAGGTSAATATFSTPIATTLTRDMEYLERAPVAVKTDDGVYLGWRLLGLDDRVVPFHVYRDGERMTKTPITTSTNFVDPDGTQESRYLLTALIGDREVTVSDEFGVWADQYLDIPLDRPAGGTTPDGVAYTYSPGDMSVGDLDGDGEYEFVLAWNSSIWKDNSQPGYTGNVYLDAYEFDGTRLWRMDLGVNIRGGAHYTQFQVYDLDSDGRAEVAFKTADGTIDGTGAVIGDPTADYRNSAGYILSGPEYLTVFDGLTGAALDTIDYVPGRGDVASWGDTYGNRVDRFLAGVAYFDGENPSLMFSRGYYTRTVLAAWDFRNGELVQRWVFDSNDYGKAYEEQGNHNLTTTDVDRDGLDEVVYGAMTIDDDGTPLYNTGLHHGDALHVADHVVDRPGLEVFSVFESPMANGQTVAAMRDAETGEVLWRTEGNADTGRGSAADIDPTYPGSEAWHPTSDSVVSDEGLVKTAAGEIISTKMPMSSFVQWWDGDLLRELAGSEYNETTRYGTATISKWNVTTKAAEVIERFDGILASGSKAQPILQADLLGDWREESILWHEGDPTTIRLVTTTDATEHRIPTLMHDPQYRQAIAWQNTAYNQPPHPSFYIGPDMAQPPAAKIAYVNAPAGDETAPVISGVPSGTIAGKSTLQLAIAVDDPESGIRSLEVIFDGQRVDADELVDLSGKSGDVEVSVRAVNHAGLLAEQVTTVLLVPADSAQTAPGRGTLSNTSGWANGLHDGRFDVVMNLWWGTPGSIFRLYENGELLATRVLGSTSGTSQTTGVTIEGRPNGTYVYTGELINSRGATATTSTTVKVTSAAPAKPVVSHDNHDGDGAFKITADLWWGTNATSYRVLLDGNVVGTGPLGSATPGPQRATAFVTGIAVGRHTLIAVFVNQFGESASSPVTVDVKR